MELSFGEKLILIMLSEIHEKLKIEGDIDPQFVQNAIFNEELWSLAWKYPGIAGSSERTTPPHVGEVSDILAMWEALEHSYKQLPPEGKEKVRAEVKQSGGDVRFRGFDGNNETEYMGAADTLINHLDRYVTFKGRGLNAHMPMIPTYRQMVEMYQTTRTSQPLGTLSAEQIIQVLNG